VLAGLSGAALALAPSGRFDASVDPEALTVGGVPAGAEPDGDELFALTGGAGVGCSAGGGSGVMDGVVDEFVGAGVGVDPGEDAGDSAVPG